MSAVKLIWQRSTGKVWINYEFHTALWHMKISIMGKNL